MDKLTELIDKVPTILWIIIGVTVIIPFFAGAFKKGTKVLGFIAVVLILLFIFPSIGSSFMERAQLSWNDESKTLTNRNGTEISFGELFEQKEAVMDTVNNEKIIDGVKKFEVTSEIIERAKLLGLTLSEDMVITEENGKYYLVIRSDTKQEISEDVLKVLGILQE